MPGIIPKAGHQLLELRQLRHRRADETLRARQSAIDKSAAAVDAALTDLLTWRRDRPRLEYETYDSLIGKAVTLNDLEEAKAKVISLHNHERLLEQRLEEALSETEQARWARAKAYTAARKAYRELEKCDSLVRALKAGPLKETDLQFMDLSSGPSNSAGAAVMGEWGRQKFYNKAQERPQDRSSRGSLSISPLVWSPSLRSWNGREG
ncbi:type III secretion system stalk subunit SctO [Bradyrhizobium sp. USDA 10063]